MRLMMLGVEHLSAEVVELLPQYRVRMDTLVDPEGSGLDERSEAARRQGEIALEKAVQLEERLLVEGHRGELVRSEPGAVEAETSGVPRKRGVALDSGEALLLGGSNDLPVGQQAGGAVVVEGGDPQDVLRQRGTGGRR